MKTVSAAGILLSIVWVSVATAHEDFGGEDALDLAAPQEIIVWDKEDQPARDPSPAPAFLDKRLDEDEDGLSGEDEARLGTNASNPDTDGDGYIDGLEVMRGYNPLAPSPGDKVVITELDTTSPSEAYKVTGVRLEVNGGQETLIVTGAGPANSLVALLVMSGEIKAWMARADSTGRFIYISSDTLALGPHRIYAASIAATGRVLAVSKSLSFVRAENRLEVIDEETMAAPLSDRQEKPSAIVVDNKSGKSRKWLVIAIGTSIVSAALIIGGGFAWWRRARGNLLDSKDIRQYI